MSWRTVVISSRCKLDYKMGYIENQKFFREFLTDLHTQLDGGSGKAGLSVHDQPVDTGKNLEILDPLIPFDINRRSLLTKILASLEKTALDEEHYFRTREMLTALENYLQDIAFSEKCDIICSKLSVPALLRAVGIELRDDYASLGEKLLDYMELVREYDRDKLFVTVNMRGCFLDEEAAEFLRNVRLHGFHLLMLATREYVRLPDERRIVIDKDLCEF